MAVAMAVSIAVAMAMAFSVTAPRWPTALATASTLMMITVVVAVVVVTAFDIGSMPRDVAGRVLTRIPVVADEIDTLAAGTILAAISDPVPAMAGRDTQVDWSPEIYARGNDHRLRVDQPRRREAADVELTVETRLTDADRDADIRRLGCEAEQSAGDAECKFSMQGFHGNSFRA